MNIFTPFCLESTLHIHLIWHHLTILLFPNMKTKTNLAGKQYRTDDEVIICSWGLFRGSGWEVLYHGNPCSTDGRNVWIARENMLKNKQRLVRIDLCIIVSLWTFHSELLKVRADFNYFSLACAKKLWCMHCFELYPGHSCFSTWSP